MFLSSLQTLCVCARGCGCVQQICVNLVVEVEV